MLAERVWTKKGAHGKTDDTGPLEAAMPIPGVLHSFAPTMLRRCVRNLRTILCVAIGTIPNVCSPPGQKNLLPPLPPPLCR